MQVNVSNSINSITCYSKLADIYHGSISGCYILLCKIVYKNLVKQNVFLIIENKKYQSFKLCSSVNETCLSMSMLMSDWCQWCQSLRIYLETLMLAMLTNLLICDILETVVYSVKIVVCLTVKNKQNK